MSNASGSKAINDLAQREPPDPPPLDPLRQPPVDRDCDVVLTGGVTDGVVTLGKARHVDVTGDRAYIVSPAIFAYKLKGKPVKEGGATFTFALQKGATGWRIVGWTWAKG